MSKILQEVRKISSEKIAEEQTSSEQKYPAIIEKIKAAARLGKTECEFSEYEIDQYSKRLLEADGFTCFATSRTSESHYLSYDKNKSINIWIVRW